MKAAESAVLIGGQWVPATERLVVHDKYTGEAVGSVGKASAEQVVAAVAAAEHAHRTVPFSPYQRAEVLIQASRLLAERRQTFVDTMVAESGFTANDCSTEVTRCIETLKLSGEEARRISGELVPVQGAPGQDPRKLCFTLRTPLGVVVAITPFNSPLNTVAHKVAPALAAGNAVVLKPASYVPMTSALLCQLLLDAGTPPGYLSLVFGGADVGTWLLKDQRVRFYTFTGSTEVGRIIQQHAGLRRTQLELGNISSTIVCADAKLEAAAEKCVGASFRKAGQVCTSVQRILVERRALPEFSDAVLSRTRQLAWGNPRQANAYVGPMIDAKETRRAKAWIDEAQAQGARLLHGGALDRAAMQPTVLADVTPNMRVMNEEIFAPVISLVPYDDFDDAVAMANGTPFGLAVGLFTSDLTRALSAIRQLDMGSIHVNDTSSSRVDLMPYGGIKDSGFGQEGPKYAIRDMSEERMVTLNPL
jgi:acyl-CoA reductase-like NAD-dependent aldehyde dehydrogenase